MNRGHVLAGFSDSAEHIQMLRAPVESGLWDRDETTTQLAQFYSAAFDRRPDATGLAYWTNSVKAGSLTAMAVADFFAASPEFAARYGSLSNAQFVDRMYHNILDRPGEAEGTTLWTHALDAGAMDRGDVLAGFASSVENQHKTAAAMDNGILLA